MRRLALAFLLTVSLPVVAQDALTSRGTWIVEGTAGVNRSSSGQNTTTTGFLIPRLGVFVTDGLAVGARLTASVSSSTQEVPFPGTGTPTEISYRNTSLGAAPFATYYIGASESPVLPYVSASAGIRSARFRVGEGDDDPRTSTTTLLEAEVAAGGLVRLGTNVGLTGEAFYTWYDSALNDTYGLRGGIAVFLGR